MARVSSAEGDSFFRCLSSKSLPINLPYSFFVANEYPPAIFKISKDLLFVIYSSFSKVTDSSISEMLTLRPLLSIISFICLDPISSSDAKIIDSTIFFISVLTN